MACDQKAAWGHTPKQRGRRQCTCGSALCAAHPLVAAIFMRSRWIDSSAGRINTLPWPGSCLINHFTLRCLSHSNRGGELTPWLAKDVIPNTASRLIIYKTIINLFRAVRPMAAIWAAIKAEGISQRLTVSGLTCVYVERSGRVARAQALNTRLERI